MPFEWLNNTVEGVGGVLEPATNMSIVGAATRIANIAIILSFGLATISLAYAFVLYVYSRGDPKAVHRASQALLWAVIALIVSIAAWGIKTLFFGLLGFSDVA
ncbi:MAG: hypothetical protein KatS3mg101_0048 [Patescibacteria group bacterium]|nr:MAG: hypothetical protein KatS3mg101_0048 [Patescibacteria group bacterium]